MKRDTIIHFFDLLCLMTGKELQARYKNTAIGFFWLVASPLLQMLIIGFVFPLFVKQPSTYYNYYLFTGLLVWNFFSLSLTAATVSFVASRNLIKKAIFPRSVIPLSIIFSHCIHFFAAFILLAIFLFFVGTLRISSIWYGVVGFGMLLIFLIGVSLIASTYNVRHRDVSFVVQAALIVWFYATPILYSIDTFPKHVLWAWQFNPLTAPLQWIQAAMVGTGPPSLEIQVSNAIIIAATICFGVWIFRSSNDIFDDWL